MTASGQNAVEHGTDAINVGPCALLAVCKILFRCGIAVEQLRIELGVIRAHGGDAEAEQLQLALIRHKNRFGAESSVQHARIVQQAERGKERREDAADGIPAELAGIFLEVIQQRAAFEILIDRIGGVVLREQFERRVQVAEIAQPFERLVQGYIPPSEPVRDDRISH